MISMVERDSEHTYWAVYSKSGCACCVYRERLDGRNEVLWGRQPLRYCDKMAATAFVASILLVAVYLLAIMSGQVW